MLAAGFNIYVQHRKKHCIRNETNNKTSYMYVHIMRYQLMQNHCNTLRTLLLQNIIGQFLSPSRSLSLEFKCSIYIINSKIQKKVGPTGVYLLDFFCSGNQFFVLLSPYLCFISF